MKRFIYISLLLCLPTIMTVAETKWDHLTQRNEIRIGWGDQLFESLMWHNPTNIATTLPATWQRTYHENYRYNQHLWLEYQWRFNAEISRSKGHYFYNLVIMPTVRFTYFHHPNVNIYSGLGVGLGINGGTEKNVYGKNTDVGAAINFTVIGVSANYKRWFIAVDFGGLYSLKNANTIFMASSRIINASIGARF